MKKIQCQPQLSEMVPPRIGPRIGATMVVIAQMPVACACFSFGKMLSSRVWLIGIKGPPHSPCPMRKATSEPRLQAIPHSRENDAEPGHAESEHADASPNRRASQPVKGTQIASATA